MKHSTKSATKQKSKQKPKQKVNLAFEAIGTSWSIDFTAPPADTQTLSTLITSRIVLFDKTYSRFRSDSWVHILRTPGQYKVPKDFIPIFTFYSQLNNATGGAVTPLIGDIMERAGYDAEYSLAPMPLKKIPTLAETLVLNKYTLHVKYPCVFDIGAAGKGYLVDIIGELLVQQGVDDFVIDAGGDILHHSPNSLDVGLEDPSDTSKAIGVLRLDNQALCGSASNRRAWADTHHIINPLTLMPVRDITASWVTASSAMLADGIATALFFVEPAKLTNFAFEYAILKADESGDTVITSKYFAAEIFKKGIL